MAEGPGASAVVVLAGVALAASLAGVDAVGTLGWASTGVLPGGPPTVAAGLAGLALVAGILGRHGTLDHGPSGVLAGLSLAGVVGIALWALVAAGTAPLAGTAGAAVAGVAALLGVPAAVATALGLGTDRVLAKLRATAAAVGIGGVALVGGLLFVLVVARVILGVLGIEQPSETLTVALTTPLFAVGLGLVAAGYLAIRDLEWSYVDLAVPGIRDVVYAVGGTLGLLAGIVLISLLFRAAGVPIAESSIEQQAVEGDPTFLLVLIPLSYVAIGLGEELVFRNVIQKYLYEEFTRAGAVVVASVVFALVHFDQYADPNPLATVSSLAVIMVLSLVLGAVYERTENLLVPIFVHGSVNAIQFAALYVQLTGGG